MVPKTARGIIEAVVSGTPASAAVQDVLAGIEEAEKKPKFEVGDKVEIIGNPEEPSWLDGLQGEIEAVEDDPKGQTIYRVKLKGNMPSTGVPEDSLKKV